MNRKTFHAIKDKTKSESEERKKDPYYSGLMPLIAPLIVVCIVAYAFLFG